MIYKEINILMFKLFSPPQGKGEILTYWLIGENKLKRLKRLESVSATHGFNVSNVSGCDMDDDTIYFRTSVDGETNRAYHSVRGSLDNTNGNEEDSVNNAVTDDLCSSENVQNFRETTGILCNGKHKTDHNRHRNGDIETRVEMKPLLGHVT